MRATEIFALVLASSCCVRPALGDHGVFPAFGTYTCAMMGMGGVMPMGSFTVGSAGPGNSYYTTNPGDGTKWKVAYDPPSHMLAFEGNMNRFIGLYRGNIGGADIIELWGTNQWGNRVKMSTCTLR